MVFYDGHCALCQGWVQFILLHDVHDRFKFASLDSNTARAQGIKPVSNLEADTVVVLKDGQLYTHSTAALKVLFTLGGIWKLSWILTLVPRFLRDVIYRFIARNRYHWFGRKESCLVPEKKWQYKFLS